MAKRALTVDNILNTKRVVLPFTGSWLDAFGEPELGGTWLVWGSSGSGKSSMVMQLCKYFAGFDQIKHVAYNSLEEGNSKSIKSAILRHGMQEVKEKFYILEKEPIAELIERLHKQRSAEVIVIDSLQYARLNYRSYIRLTEEFPHKTFILVSHADGKNPAGKTAQSIRYDAFVKIRVEGYKAFPVSRYRDGESTPFTIWEEGAIRYHGVTPTN